MARTLARLVNQSLDGRMYVENITGATGLMGMREVLNAQPDGYTLMLLTTTNTIAPGRDEGLSDAGPTGPFLRGRRRPP